MYKYMILFCLLFAGLTLLEDNMYYLIRKEINIQGQENWVILAENTNRQIIHDKYDSINNKYNLDIIEL